MPNLPWVEAIKARVEKATPGPWYTMPGGFGKYKQPHVSSVYFAGNELLYIARCGDCAELDLGEDRHSPTDDAELIAHAREDIPRLLRAVEVLEPLVDELAKMPCESLSDGAEDCAVSGAQDDDPGAWCLTCSARRALADVREG